MRYLETHLSTAIRVYHFTTTESFLAFKERADIYLLDEAFFQRLSEEKQNVLLREKRLILLTAQEEEGTFCKYHNPKKLLDRLSRFSDEMEDLASREDRREEERVEGREEGRETARTRLTMIYSPVYEEKLKEIARSFMKEGDVYMRKTWDIRRIFQHMGREVIWEICVTIFICVKSMSWIGCGTCW